MLALLANLLEFAALGFQAALHRTVLLQEIGELTVPEHGNRRFARPVVIMSRDWNRRRGRDHGAAFGQAEAVASLVAAGASVACLRARRRAVPDAAVG